eukprot:356232-Chlamydomonas_euryale.AAC.8
MVASDACSSRRKATSKSGMARRTHPAWAPQASAWAPQPSSRRQLAAAGPHSRRQAERTRWRRVLRSWRSSADEPEGGALFLSWRPGGCSGQRKRRNLRLAARQVAEVELHAADAVDGNTHTWTIRPWVCSAKQPGR